MSLNGDTLGTAIKNAINALTPTQKEDIEVVWQTIAGEIVSHFTANADVSTSVTATYLNPDDVTGTGTGGIS